MYRLLPLCVLITSIAWGGGGKRIEVREHRNLPYLKDATPEQTLDLYVPPKGSAATPLLVFVHGGAWISGDKGDYGNFARAFAADGVAVAVVNYRLSTNATIKHPAHVQDLAAALEWLLANHAVHGFGPDKVTVMGHSAGAHMAAMYAIDSRRDARVRRYIGIAGIYDLPALHKKWPRYRDWFIDSAFGGGESHWRKASPTTLAPPVKTEWLLIHSPTDELVDLPQSERYFKRLQDGGVPSELETAFRGSHFGLLESLDTTTQPFSKRVIDFVWRRS